MMNHVFIITVGVNSMPELPEVETVRQTLKRAIIGQTIRDVDVFYEKMIHGCSVEKFKKSLKNQTLQDIQRYGKYLVFIFDQIALISHLRMEGRYFLKDIDYPRDKHEHIIIYFNDDTTLRYQDTRKFGTMELSKIDEVMNVSGIQKLGVEPIEEKIDVDEIYQKIHRRKQAIKTVLLDQTVVAGLGNIYVDETLFLSGIHPEKQSNTLRKKDVEKLLDSSKIVLEKAIKLGGSSIRTYTSSLGVTGRFQNELFVHTREHEPCKVCHTKIIKIKVGGRGTYFCPTCQTFKLS
jgi:formamidopyrimidine-DNA glycosylase